jgi:hypothetical protein
MTTTGRSSRKPRPFRLSATRRGAAASTSPFGARRSGCSTNPMSLSRGREWRWRRRVVLRRKEVAQRQGENQGRNPQGSGPETSGTLDCTVVPLVLKTSLGTRLLVSNPSSSATVSFVRRRWTPRHIRDPKPRLKTQPLVKSMDSGVCPTTLHQHVVAVRRPSVRQRGLNDGFAVTSAAQLGMGDDILQEGMASSAAKQVRCCDEHAGRSNAVAVIGHEDIDAPLREGFLPDAFSPFLRLSGSAYL